MNVRVKEIRKSIGLTQTEFGKKLGVSGPAITRIEKGERKLTEQMAKAICREFGVEYSWLTEGLGEMFENKDDEIDFLIDSLMSGESERARSLFKAFAKLGAEEWENLVRIIDKLKESMDS